MTGEAARACSTCDKPTETSGYYCRSCRAAYMRRWRIKVRDARLHAVVTRTLSRASRETERAR